MEQELLKLVTHWYLTTGYLGIVFAMALESCCIPLPSEIVMPLAGFMVFSHPGQFSLVGVGIAGALGCVIGSAVAYSIGAAGGRPLMLKYGKYVLISKADSDRADRWFERYGARVAFFSRLLPVIRTYISLPAGIARMHFGQFILFTLLGSLPWTFALAFFGYKLGPTFDQATQELSGVFHGLDIVVVLVLAVLVFLYIRRHIKHNAAAHNANTSTSSDGWERPRQPAQRR